MRRTSHEHQDENQAIFDNWQFNLWQPTIFFFNLLQSADQSLTIHKKDLKISVNCQRLTSQLSKIVWFSSWCSWLVLLVYFLSCTLHLDLHAVITNDSLLPIPCQSTTGNGSLFPVCSKLRCNSSKILAVRFMLLIFIDERQITKIWDPMVASCDRSYDGRKSVGKLGYEMVGVTTVNVILTFFCGS